MADIQKQSALSEHDLSVNVNNDSISISEKRIECLYQINGAPIGVEFDRALSGIGAKSRSASSRSISCTGAQLLWNGPGMWLVEAESTQTIDSLTRNVEETGATLTDLSQARTIFRLSGTRTVDLLAKGCPIDIESLTPQDVVSSHVGHINVTIHCVEPNTFDVYVFRSFGEAFYEWLVDAAIEWSQ